MILSVIHSFLAFLLTTLLAMSTVGAAAEKKDGSPTWDSAAYFTYVKNRDTISRIFHLGLMPPAGKLDITFDETLTTAFRELEDASGFRVEDVTSNVPDIYTYVRWLYAIAPNPFNNQRDKWMLKGDEYDEGGDGVNMVLYRMLGVSVGLPKKVYVKTVPKTDEPGVYDVFIDMTYGDGSVRSFDAHFDYNPESGLMGSPEGLGGLGYNFNFKGMWAFTTDNPMQRSLGYTKLYDDLILKTTKMVNIDTVRLKFPYQNKDYMLQLWKGRYFITSAGEVGLYNKPQSRKTTAWVKYDAAMDAERIPMSFKLTAQDSGNDIVLVDREKTLHWWMTGFAMRKTIYLSNRLTLQTDILAPDQEFYDSLVGALAAEKKINGSFAYVQGPAALEVKIAWGPGAGRAFPAAAPANPVPQEDPAPQSIAEDSVPPPSTENETTEPTTETSAETTAEETATPAEQETTDATDSAAAALEEQTAA